jgi:hypothetical protein
LKIKLEEILPGKEIEETGIRSEKENNASSSTILSFFSAQLTRLSSFLLSANHVFFCLISKETTGASWSQLWKDEKESHHPLTWKEIVDDHRIRIKYSGFLFFAHPRLQLRINVIFVS